MLSLARSCGQRHIVGKFTLEMLADARTLDASSKCVVTSSSPEACRCFSVQLVHNSSFSCTCVVTRGVSFSFLGSDGDLAYYHLVVRAGRRVAFVRSS